MTHPINPADFRPTTVTADMLHELAATARREARYATSNAVAQRWHRIASAHTRNAMGAGA